MEEKEIRLQIAGIEILEMNLNHPENSLPSPRTYNIETKIKTVIKAEEKRFIIIPRVVLIYDDDKTIHASLQVSFTFEIDNFEDFKADGNYVFPEQFIVMMVSISISTLRGIMYSQFRGTFMSNTILPIIDPKSFVKVTED